MNKLVVGVNDLASVNPLLAKEWNYDKNDGISPSEVTSKSDKKVWWRCGIGHEWEATVGDRSRGNGCPICAGKKVLIGYNDLKTVYPHLIPEFDSEKNHILPHNVYAGGQKKYWWKCSQGHSYQTSIHNRGVVKTGCPICSNHAVLKGYNDLESLYPNIAKEFLSELNGITADKVLAGGDKKYWWECSYHHRYKTSPNCRILRNNGCPYCSGHRLMKGFNDLKTTHPALEKTWDAEKNLPNAFSDFSHGSAYNAWWICEKGHSYQCSINERCGNNRGCPICQNRKILEGYNDLLTTNPEMAKEWHPSKNRKSPNQVFENATKKYWWLCEQGHEYQATPNHRSNGTGCPICGKEKKVSFPEKTIFFYLANFFGEVRENYNPGLSGTINVDMYIPKYRIAIEYDGAYWHQNPEKDLEKNRECRRIGICLIRIREKGCPILNDSSHDFYTDPKDYHAILRFISEKIKELFNVDFQYDLNIKRDETEISSLFLKSKKDSNICVTHPHVAQQWHPTKNGSLRVESITLGSTKRVWWKCEKGHEWMASVNNRCKGQNCPYCSNRAVLKGFNDLATTDSLLLQEWDFEKNGIMTPYNIVRGSGKKAWWKCEKGHSYLHEIRSKRVKICPLCMREE